MPLPPLNALRAFEAVARRLSFKDAADELSVTPAALSHQVKALEAFLERPLFIRANRRISLTPDGRTLHTGLTDAFGRLEAAVDAIRPREANNVLVVSTGPAFAAKWFAPRLAHLMEALPDLDIRLSATLSASTFGSDGVDFAIRFGAGNYPNLFCRRLMGEGLAPMASPDFLEAHSIEAPEDLIGQSLIHDESLRPFIDESDWTDWFVANGLDAALAQRGIRFNQADHAIDAAVNGAGVLLGRDVLCAWDLQAGRLQRLPIPSLETDLAFYAVCPKGHETRPKEAAFLNWLLDEIERSSDKA